MESAGIRHRNKTKSTTTNGPTTAAEPAAKPPTFGQEIPHFTINLSKRPEDRYTHIVPHFLPQLQTTNFQVLFDDLVGGILPRRFIAVVPKLASLLLRRVYSDEETAELKGISRETGVAMYLLVAFNVLLDILLGCTSGGVLVDRHGAEGWKQGMLHFRTLDWGMDPLRRIVVKLDFVRHEGGPVVATTVGYFGYVGVLTGVRQGLSLSLNFRPYHDASTLKRRVDFRRHQLMVILGMRPSISSILRKYLLAENPGKRRSFGGRIKFGQKADAGRITMETILEDLKTSSSTSAYLIFCTPTTVYSIEKDNHSAFLRSSNTFLTTYNHDAIDEGDPEAVANAARQFSPGPDATGMGEVIHYGRERKARMDKMYSKRLRRRQKKYGREGNTVALEDVYHFVSDDWITDELTHYAVIMDPEAGEVMWCRKFDGAESDLSQMESL